MKNYNTRTETSPLTPKGGKSPKGWHNKAVGAAHGTDKQYRKGDGNAAGRLLPFGEVGWGFSFRGLLGGFLLLFLFTATATLSHAQMAGTPYPLPQQGNRPVIATEGRDFWVTFGKNLTSPATGVYLALQLNNGNNAAVTVRLTFTAKTGTNTASISVPANTSQQVDLSSITLTDGSLIDGRQYVYQRGTTTATNNLSLNITSSDVIAVIAFNTAAATTDATILMPPIVWGTDYYNLSYIPRYNLTPAVQDVNMIVANQPTNVTVTNLAGTTVGTVTLQTGQVYYNAADTTDFTGYHITTDKPVAYFVHNTLTVIPSPTTSAGDILFQQLMPSAQWGQYFLIPNETNFASNTFGTNSVRILASQNNTVVNFTNAIGTIPNGTTVAPNSSWVCPQFSGSVCSANVGTIPITADVTLNAGQWTEVKIGGGQDGYSSISATKPVAVVSLMHGGSDIGGSGSGNQASNRTDPAICHIAPVANLIPTTVISPFVPPATANSYTYLGSASGNPTTSPRHYALVISPTATKNNVLITRNGQNITASGTLTDAANAPSQDATDPTNTTAISLDMRTISARTQWVDVPAPINGVQYSYIRYDFNYLNDRNATFRITAPDFNSGGGILVTQVGLGFFESYTFNSGSAATTR